MISAAAIPQIPGDMGVLGQHAAALTGLGADFPDTGRRVHSTWQTLGPVYSAPEAAQLFAATGPVQTITASVGQDFTAVGGALSTYATEVDAIKARLQALRDQATAFEATARADPEWREDEDQVNRHNQLLSDVNAAVADFQDAQRRCANSILALYSDRRYVAENGDGTIADNEFGYSKDMLDAVLGQGEALPWGKAEEHDRGFLGDVGAFFVGIKDGAVEMVKGLGALIGYADGQWSWANAGAAWKGLGMFALALSPVALAINSVTDLPGIPKGALADTLLGAGKALIAYDTWGEDKSKAAGMVTFNVVSAIIGTKGAGSALRGGGAAAQGSRVAVVAKAGAGAVKVGDFIARMPTVTDLAGKAIAKFPGFKVPDVTIPNVDTPPTHVDTPSPPSGGRPGELAVPDGVIDQRVFDPPSTSGSPSVGDAVGDGARNTPPPSATLTPDGVIDGRTFDPPTPNIPDGPPLVQDGVIGGGRNVDTPATPGADAPDTPPTRDSAGERTLPPSATLTPDGVIDGRTFDPPTPNIPDGPPLVQDGVIGGGRGIDAPSTAGADGPLRPDAEVPARVPERELVGAGARGADAPAAGGIDTPGPSSRGAEVPGRAGLPDQPITGGGRGSGFDTPPARPDVPAGGGRGGGFDTPPVRPDVPVARFDADPPVGRGPETPTTPDAPGDLPPADVPSGRDGAPDAPGRGDGPDGPGGNGPGDNGPGNGPGGDGPGGDGPGDGPGGDGYYDDGRYYDGDDAPPPDGTPQDGAPGAEGSLPPGVHPPLVRDELLPPRELNDHYKYENDPTHPGAAFGGRVEYFTPDVLEAHRVVVIDGRLHWAHDGSPLDTSNASTVHSAGEPRAMFVMDRNGNLYVSPEQIVGQLHHSSFLGGGPVAGAGEIAVVNGVPQVVSRKSGHYQPLPENQQTVADVLREQGLDTSGIQFEAGF
ncbi:hypothetical protein [Pseudonocardia humida]|uniref:Uncharacterized protein n=1 Tax=Pseudonocardia humida TaxID=2800819 RepID=A0ABT1A5T4_9PSEU|nr:hypothetical protein [Pseudonocardia humida]MCO1658381.1 hypothetical protein [Pseudonocardia humida]